MDEPTAALAVAETRKVLSLARKLAERGCAVVLISHNLVDVFAVADRMVRVPAAAAKSRNAGARRPNPTRSCPSSPVPIPDARALEAVA